MPPEEFKNLPVVPFSTFEGWADWLAGHGSCQGVWLKFAKKSSGLPSITYEEAREGAIMHGWIDGQKYGYDESYYLIRFTPRRPRSGWSKVNVAIAERLLAEGLLSEAGLREVETAQKDGRFAAAYDSQSTMQVPPDFQRELAQHPAAEEFFLSLKSANRYAFLYRLQTARNEGRRRDLLNRFVEMLERGEALHLL